MRKLYAEPILEIREYNMAQTIWTSEPGPPDLNSGEDLDPDGGNIDANGYFAEN